MHFIFSLLFLIYHVSWSGGFDHVPAISLNSPNDSLVMVDAGDTEEGFYLFYKNDSQQVKNVVLFIHGYGAINPMIYGGWIRHMTDQGLIVIFPRYQINLISPAPGKFAECISYGFQNAVHYLNESQIAYTTEEFYIVGHSYGGALTAYLGGNYESMKLPRPSGLMICQPGTGPFTSFNLDDYGFISQDIKVAVIVGDEDHTVGDVLGKKIYNTLQVKDKLWIRHFADTTDASFLTASHYEPYSPDAKFDTGDRNYSARRALQKGKIDDLDQFVYWSIFDHMRIRESQLATWIIPQILINQEKSLSDYLKNTISP